MVRFVFIGDQICEGEKDFAFFDTAVDSFIEFDGESVFGSLEEFIGCYNEVQSPHSILERFTSLIDKDKINFTS